MKTTLTFTEKHIIELNRIAALDVFASKIAKTILSKNEYSASSRQVDILNEISEIEFFISDNYFNIYEDKARERKINNLPSSMR